MTVNYQKRKHLKNSNHSIDDFINTKTVIISSGDEKIKASNNLQATKKSIFDEMNNVIENKMKKIKQQVSIKYKDNLNSNQRLIKKSKSVKDQKKKTFEIKTSINKSITEVQEDEGSSIINTNLNEMIDQDDEKKNQNKFEKGYFKNNTFKSSDYKFEKKKKNQLLPLKEDSNVKSVKKKSLKIKLKNYELIDS